MNYPKVLIIGEQFDRRSGSGITLSNLFCGWNIDNIAVASSEIFSPDVSVCNKYYYLGYQEIKWKFPFNLKLITQKKEPGINADLLKNDQMALAKPNENWLKRIQNKVITISGLLHRRREIVISHEFKKWVNDFTPELIYTQLSSFELIEFVSKFQKEFNLPLVIHIMDDWPKTIVDGQKFIFKHYWKALIGKNLKNLFNNADLLLSISDAMSDEYKIRYSLNFIPFHNPIDLNHWSSGIGKDYERKEVFRILYAGRIGNGLRNCLFEVASAISEILENNTFKIELQIQATSDDGILDKLKKFNFVKINPPVEYTDLPKIFSGADLLLLPNDFDKKSINFLKYSMPTKASEYMASGTPILLYSHPDTAVAKHAIKNNWAFVVSENSCPKLKVAIKKLYEEMELRKNVGVSAQRFAFEHYDSTIVRAYFRDVLYNASLSRIVS